VKGSDNLICVVNTNSVFLWHDSNIYIFYPQNIVFYTSVSQPLSDRDPVNSFFIRRGPGPNRFTHKYLSIFYVHTLN